MTEVTFCEHSDSLFHAQSEHIQDIKNQSQHCKTNFSNFDISSVPDRLGSGL